MDGWMDGCALRFMGVIAKLQRNEVMLSLSLSRDNYFTLPKNEASKNAVIFLLNHHPNIQPNFENVNGLLIYPKIPDQYFHYPIIPD